MNRRALRTTLYAALAAATALGVIWAHQKLTRDALPVRSVAVEGTSTPARADEVAVYAAVKRGAPLLGLSPDDVKTRVEAHPWIASAQVRRVPPDALIVEVRERQASAVLMLEGVPFLVDQFGTPFKRVGASDPVNLPVINGAAVEELPKLVELIALAPSTLTLDALDVDDERLQVQLSSGERATLGRAGHEAKLRTLARTVDALNARGQRAHHVYLNDDRRPERVAVRLRSSPEMAGNAGKQDRESGNTGAARAASSGG